MRLNYLYISKSLVGADAYIGPAEYTIFTVIFGEFATSQRADVSIGPHSQTGSCMRIRRFLTSYLTFYTDRSIRIWVKQKRKNRRGRSWSCLLYTSDAADELDGSVRCV